MLGINYDYSLQINVSPAAPAPEWAVVSSGFDSISKSLNESVYQGAFLGDSGFASTEVTGGQLILKLSGIRIYGDRAQDFIFSGDVKNNFGEARKTDFMITYPDGAVITGKVTLAKITEGGGSADSPDSVFVEIHFNGKPVYSESSGG